MSPWLLDGEIITSRKITHVSCKWHNLSAELMFSPRGRGWRELCERHLIMIQRETRQQTALSSLKQLPRGGGSGGCGVWGVHWKLGALSTGSLQRLCIMNYIPAHCSKKKLIFISLRTAGVLSHTAVLAKIRRSWKKPHRDETGSLGEESVHLFKTDVFKEGQSFPAFLGLSFILGPVAQITWLL